MTEERTMTVGQKVLVVDDVPVNLFYLQKLLETSGVEVLTATSGAQAIELAHEHDLALILLDVQMPGMDGFETADRLQGDSATKEIPIIFVTAISKEEEHVFRGYASGAVDYLLKPVDAVVLRSKVTVFCQIHKQKSVIRRQMEEIQRKNDLLEKQIQEIRALSGLIPICADCKKIRNDGGYWEAVENYISTHSEAQFSHGLCPDCLKKHYGNEID